MRIRQRAGVLLSTLLIASGVAAAAPPDYALIEAVKAGDRAAVQNLVRQKTDINLLDAEGATALHWAVHRNDTNLADLLLRAGARAQVPNRYGVTPLELAAVNGAAGMIERLIKAGADVNAVGPGGQTPLMTAARVGGLEPIRTLLAHGATVNARQKGSGQTALMWAAAENNVDAIRLLLEAGAELEAYSGEAPATEPAKRRAATAKGIGLEQLLQRHKAKRVDDFTRVLVGYAAQAAAARMATSFTPLHFAVREGHMEATRVLLEAGAAVDKPIQPTGMTPMIQAIHNAHFELAAYLIDKGADIKASAHGYTALHETAKVRAPVIKHANPVPTGRITSLDLARKILDGGADPNARMSADWYDGYRHRINWLGATPLTVAAKGIDVDLMRLLLKHGADPSIKTIDEMTPLMAAAGVGVWNSGEDFGTTRADDPQAFEAVKLLVEAGNDPRAVDANGETAVHGAAYTGRNAVVEYLANLGAPLDTPNVLGWTPLRIADGVQYAGFAKHQRHTAEFIRGLLKARGLPVPEAGNDLASPPLGSAGEGGSGRQKIQTPDARQNQDKK